MPRNEFKGRVCAIHGKLLVGATTCDERFTDKHGNSMFCETADEVTLVEKRRLDKEAERTERLEALLEKSRAETARYKQGLHNVNTYIGAEAKGPQVEIRAAVEAALRDPE
jgi:hypothetical protein